MDDRTPGYDEPDRDELTRPLSLAEWDYLRSWWSRMKPPNRTKGARECRGC